MKTAGNKKQGWAVAVLAVNMLFLAANAWALGAGLPDQQRPDPAPVRCDQDLKSCFVSTYSCIAQGMRKSGKVGRETGYSELSEADAGFRATTHCISGGMEGCQVVGCDEERREVSAKP